MGRELDEITGAVVDAAVKLHVRLGPGLLESVYEAVLARQLIEQGFAVQRQKIVSFTFEGLQFDEGFRVDLLVDDLIVVELKSVYRLSPVHSKQVLTYLRLLNLRSVFSSTSGQARLRRDCAESSTITNPHQCRLCE